MATAQDIAKVAAAMPKGTAHWEIERDIESGDIKPDDYPAHDPDKEL